MNANRIPIVFHADLPRCERCGAPLSSPGLCAACAEQVQEVQRVTWISPRAWLEPEDLMERN